MPITFHARWSSIKTFRRCQKAYDYAWVQQLTKRRPAAPLVRGSMIGECLDQIASKRSIKPVLEKYTLTYDKLFKAEKEEYGDIIGEVDRIVTNYKVLYKTDGLTYLKGKDGNRFEILVETEFKLPGLNVHFTGHIDKLVQDDKERVLVMDHKSHRSIPDPSARFNDFQLLTYVWLLPISGFEKADGVLWDYLRTKPPTIPELLKKGELTRRANLDSDYNTYMQAIKDNNLDPADYTGVLDRFKKEGGNRYFERVKLPTPNKELIDNMVTEFKQTIIQIHEVGKKGTYVRNMGKDCSWCEFHEICSTEVRGFDSTFIRKTSYKPREIQ